MKEYTEPEVTFLVLDFNKPGDTRLCLQSIKDRVKFPHLVIYLHNGYASYPMDFLKEGLIDKLIISKENHGLGIGTRDLFLSCTTEYAIYWQNDQIMGRDFHDNELGFLKNVLARDNVGSVSLAGQICGPNEYSERAHIIKTAFYKYANDRIPLSYGGAGPYHHAPWREGQMQEAYRKHQILHVTSWSPLAVDNGKSAIRQNPDGSKWEHRPDTKQLKLLSGPVKEKYLYPKFTDEEWAEVLSQQDWPEWRIPQNEIKDSFRVWN